MGKSFIYLCLLLTVSACVVSAQMANVTYPASPDNEAILRGILDNGSKYYYPSIFGRYKAGDTTLTLDDYRHLYYGFAYQDQYKPLDANPVRDKLLTLIERGGDKPTVEQIRAQIAAAEEVMLREPFSLSNINFLTYAYGLLGDSLNAEINANRFKMIMQAIRSSGTGLKEGTAFHILNFADALDMLASDGINHKKPQVVSRTVEYISFLERFKGAKGYFFDYSRAYWRKPDAPVERPRSSGFQINGIQTRKPK